MRALCIERPRVMRLVNVKRPIAGPGEVVVAVRAAGICGSDLELLEGTRPSTYSRYPVIPGHEWSGEVVDSGGDSDLEPGDRVVAEGFRSCGACDRCRDGHNNLCTAPYAETGFTHPGAFAEYVSVPTRLVHRLDGDADFEAAALLEPAACIAEGLMQADIRPGLEVAVVGAGTLGLLAVAMLHVHKPSRLVLIGTRAGRLALGREMGATESVDIASAGASSGLDSQFDFVFEATNRSGGAQTALRLVRRGGAVVLEGINGATEPSVVSDLLTLKQLRVQGVFGASSRAWRWMVDLYASSDLRLERLVTHRFCLEDYAQAFAAVRDTSVGAVKVQLHP